MSIRQPDCVEQQTGQPLIKQEPHLRPAVLLQYLLDVGSGRECAETALEERADQRLECRRRLFEHPVAGEHVVRAVLAVTNHLREPPAFLDPAHRLGGEAEALGELVECDRVDPAGVLRIDQDVVPERGVKVLLAIERVRRRDEDAPVGPQMLADVAEQSFEVRQVLDQIADDDDIEGGFNRQGPRDIGCDNPIAALLELVDVGR